MARKSSRKSEKLPAPVEIGWCELVDLPALGLARMHAKIDTGARTSSLHATRIRVFERDGAQWVRFRSPRSPGHEPVDIEAPLIEKRMVTSSNGARQERYVIGTRVRLGTHEWDGQLTLANRTPMAFPVLVGRRALRRGFIVNSAKRWMLGKPEKGK